MMPGYLLEMVRRLPPAGAPVVARSTPVVAFGDPASAEVATLGINPSAREFVKDGRLLSGAMRRLATLESLSADQLDLLTDAQVAAVAADCATYFQRQPYRQWFDPLDELLRTGVDASYYDGSACHLDLVQWATDPIWRKIPDRTIRRALLEDGVPHLRAQLAHENVRLVLLNGREVLTQVVTVGLTDLVEVGRLPVGGTTCCLYIGTGGGVRWMGWSTNLQSSFGVSRDFKQRLAAWLSEACASPAPAVETASAPAPMFDADGYLPRGTRVAGKAELEALLRRWLVDSRAPTIGDVGTFGGRPCVLIELGEQEVALNADTKRSAVEDFVRASGRDADRPWRVVENRRGRFNKVLPGPELAAAPGWYAYLAHPLSEEALL